MRVMSAWVLRHGPPGPRLLVAAVLVLGLFAASEAVGCPNCKDAVNTADPEGLNVARGYFYSILLMLAMPFTLVGSFGVYVWREVQRQKRTAAEAGSGEPPQRADMLTATEVPTASVP